MLNIKYLLVLIALFATCNLYSQDEGDDTSIEHESHFHYNHFAVFTGASSLFQRDDTHFTLSLDYLRYFSPESNFGVKGPEEAPLTTTERAYTSPVWYTP